MEQDSLSVIGAGFMLLFIVFSMIFSLLLIASLWKIFEKAGKPAWASLIPIYNIVILVEIIGKPTIWILWLIMPCVNFVFGIWATNLLAKSFGKTEGFTVGLIILPIVFYPILGFGGARYLGPSAAEAQNGFNGAYSHFNSPNNPFNKPNNPFNPNDSSNPEDSNKPTTPPQV